MTTKHRIAKTIYPDCPGICGQPAVITAIAAAVEPLAAAIDPAILSRFPRVSLFSKI
jgi:hypothetical protein